MFARARYGHGGRVGYEREWRMRPELSGGGELIDQGMHLLDIYHWLFGPLPVHSALLRTQFWDGRRRGQRRASCSAPTPTEPRPWATFHVSWTEWKNLFSLEIYCRTGKLQVDGLQGSYGPQRLNIYAMSPELGPPEVETVEYESGGPVLGAGVGAFQGGRDRRRSPSAARGPRVGRVRVEMRRDTPKRRG